MDSVSPPASAIPAIQQRRVLFSLLFASAVSAGLLLARYVPAGGFRFSGLLGDLILAWIPLLFSLFIPRLWLRPEKRLWFWTAFGLWVLFFPNTFYMTTDLMHVKKFGTDGLPQWYDLLMIASFGGAGVFLGSFSLYLMQLFVRKELGQRVGWGFAIGMLILSSYGIYLGRFLRLNSWDPIARPAKLVHGVFALMEAPVRSHVISFTVTFFFFSLAAYAFLVSLARIHEGSPAPAAGAPPGAAR